MGSNPTAPAKISFVTMMDKKIITAIKYCKKHFGESIGKGKKRIVFKDKNEVIKIPLNLEGEFGNYYEAKTSINNNKLANCNIDKKLSNLFQLNILRMEYVKHTGWSKDFDWTWSIDCGQVGLTKNGRLVAYDWENY